MMVELKVIGVWNQEPWVIWSQGIAMCTVAKKRGKF